MLVSWIIKQPNCMGWDGFQCLMCEWLLQEDLHLKRKWVKKLCYPQKRSWDMKKSLASWKRCGGVYWEGETTIAKKEIGLVCLKRTRHGSLWFVVLHLPLDLNVAMMFNISTSRKTSSYILWAPNQRPWVSLMKCQKQWTTTTRKVKY